MKITRYLMVSSAFAVTLLVASPALASSNGLLKNADGEVNHGLHLGSSHKIQHSHDDRKENTEDSDHQDRHEDRKEHETDKATIAGTVSAIVGSTITLNGRDDMTYTVNTTNAKISNRDTMVALSDIVVGDSVVVKGKLSGSVITAKKIRNLSFTQRAFLSAIGAADAGVVTAVSGSTFLLNSFGTPGTTTVTTNASTTYKVNGVATTSSALSVGSRAIVYGTGSSSTGITASLVSILNVGIGFFNHFFR